MCITFQLYIQTSADVPRTAVTHLPRSRPRSAAARRLVMMPRRKKSRSQLRLLPPRRLGRAKPRSKPTTKKMLRPSKLPRERDEPRRSSRSRRLMRKLPSKLRLQRRRAGPRKPNPSLKPTMSPPLSSPRREAVPRKPRLSPSPTRQRLMSQSQSLSLSLSLLPRRAAERRRLLPTVMIIRLRLPRPLLQSGADPRRGKHEFRPSGEHAFLTAAVPELEPQYGHVWDMKGNHLTVCICHYQLLLSTSSHARILRRRTGCHVISASLCFLRRHVFGFTTRASVLPRVFMGCPRVIAVSWTDDLVCRHTTLSSTFCCSRADSALSFHSQ